MVEIVSNLLKLTDYPFLYSFAGFLLLVTGHGPKSSDITTFVPLLVIVGLFGTALSITDPIGHLIQYILMKRMKGSPDLDTLAYYHRKAIKTLWIKYEIDKTVSMIYFMIFLTAVVLFTGYHIYAQEFCNLILVQVNNSTVGQTNTTELEQKLTDCKNMIEGLLIPFIIADVGVGLMVIYTSRKLSDRILIVGNYFEMKRYQRKKEVELAMLGEKSSEETKGKFDHQLQDYQNIKATINELLECLNEKDWTIAKVLSDNFLHTAGPI
jgi:hypothetical protein